MFQDHNPLIYSDSPEANVDGFLREQEPGVTLEELATAEEMINAMDQFMKMFEF